MIAARQHGSSKGVNIGLLGGSFDPPHLGHVHITRQALKGFGLHQVWWLVSPRNPLKSIDPVALETRLYECQKIIQSPRVIVSDIEGRLRTQSTAGTLRKLLILYPKIRFVWLMGADNLVNFHKWDQWTWIMESVPVGVMARPGEQVKAGLSRTALRYQKFRLKAADAGSLPFSKAPIWSILGGPTMDVSSTEIRASGLRK